MLNNSSSIFKTSGKMSLIPFLCKAKTFFAFLISSASNLPSILTGTEVRPSMYSFFIYFSVTGLLFAHKKRLHSFRMESQTFELDLILVAYRVATNIWDSFLSALSLYSRAISFVKRTVLKWANFIANIIICRNTYNVSPCLSPIFF